jgi:hypothetical protein
MAIEQTVEDWVKTLPEDKDIVIKVYNSFYASYLKDKIARGKGFDYLNRVSFMIPGEEDVTKSWDQKVYISPILHDYVGNGYN